MIAPEHAQETCLPLADIIPSPENDLLYDKVMSRDPDVIALSESIQELGIQEPLVISEDHYIISGHRRYVAARMAGLAEAPCRIKKGVLYEQLTKDQWMRLLREHNRQRIKTREQQTRELLVDINAKEVHAELVRYRRARLKTTLESFPTINLRHTKARSPISHALRPFLDASIAIIDRLEEHHPLTVRQIHYQLLNDPPLTHGSKPDSRYRNDQRSYQKLVKLLSRARHEGYIDYNVIDDPTRDVDVWKISRNAGEYINLWQERLFGDFARDRLQGQPRHIEIIVEKLTAKGLVRPIAFEYCIPLTIGRGYCSTSPLYEMAQRYYASGKDALAVLVVSDLDPDGDEIAHSTGQRLRDDFGVHEVEVYKAALTYEQVKSLALPSSYVKAKPSSANFDRFVTRYGSDAVYELESVQPHQLKELIEDAITKVLDVDAYNAEVAEEEKDAAFLEARKLQMLKVIVQ